MTEFGLHSADESLPVLLFPQALQARSERQAKLEAAQVQACVEDLVVGIGLAAGQMGSAMSAAFFVLVPVLDTLATNCVSCCSSNSM